MHSYQTHVEISIYKQWSHFVARILFRTPEVFNICRIHKPQITAGTPKGVQPLLRRSHYVAGVAVCIVLLPAIPDGRIPVNLRDF